MGNTKEALEILRAIMTLEYHNLNYLAQYLADSPRQRNELKRELVDAALNGLGEYGK